MKKSGIEPTSRTYTTLINAYAGANHSQDLSRFTPLLPLESRALQRITTIYNQSQTHISECVEALERWKSTPASETDLGFAGMEELVEEDEALAEAEVRQEEEISIGPTNAYLKFLGKYGRWEEMDRIYLAMDNEGPLAPDKITYSLLFSSLLIRMQQHKGTAPSPVTSPRPRDARPAVPKPVDFGPIARSMWEQAVRQFHPSNSTISSEGSRHIDSELALLALQCLLSARPADQNLAIALIPFLWHLPPPGSTTVASSSPRSGSETPRYISSDLPPSMRSIPRLPLDPRAAKTILSMFSRANQPTLAGHYAEHLLSTRTLLKVVDWGVLQTSIHALSNIGKVDGIIDILDTFQPPTGPDGWPRHVWTNALTAARWSAKFGAAMDIFRRMTHLPTGFEDGRPKKYKWSSPNGQLVDVQGRRWIEPRALMPDSKTISLFLKTALGAKVLHSARQGWTVFKQYPLKTFFTISKGEMKDRDQPVDISLLPPFASERNGEGEVKVTPGLVRAAEWRIVLARDVEDLAERVADGIMSGEELKKVHEVRRMMGEVSSYWEGRLGVRRGLRRGLERREGEVEAEAEEVEEGVGRVSASG